MKTASCRVNPLFFPHFFAKPVTSSGSLSKDTSHANNPFSSNGVFLKRSGNFPPVPVSGSGIRRIFPGFPGRHTRTGRGKRSFMISDNAWGNDPVDISGNIFARSRFRLSGISLRPERRALPGKIVCARFRSAREPDKPFAFLYRYDRQTVQTRAGCRGERRQTPEAREEETIKRQKKRRTNKPE